MIVAKAVQIGVQSAFAAMQAGAQVAQMPMIAPIADTMMQGAGYKRPNPGNLIHLASQHQSKQQLQIFAIGCARCRALNWVASRLQSWRKLTRTPVHNFHRYRARVIQPCKVLKPLIQQIICPEACNDH